MELQPFSSTDEKKRDDIRMAHVRELAEIDSKTMG